MTKPSRPDHRVTVCVVDCIDDRLVNSHARELAGHGGGFLVTMAGGAAAVLTRRDSSACIGQFTDAYGIHKFERFVVQLHLGCGKLALLAKRHWLIMALKWLVSQIPTRFTPLGTIRGMMLEGLARTGELPFWIDPDSVEDLYKLGDIAAQRIQLAIRKLYGDEVVGEVMVFDIVHDDEVHATSELIPRPD